MLNVIERIPISYDNCCCISMTEAFFLFLYMSRKRVSDRERKKDRQTASYIFFVNLFDEKATRSKRWAPNSFQEQLATS